MLHEELDIASPSVAGALRFLLSGRSAFVSGQFITVDSVNGALPDDWAAPLEGQVAVVTGAARGSAPLLRAHSTGMEHAWLS